MFCSLCVRATGPGLKDCSKSLGAELAIVIVTAEPNCWPGPCDLRSVRPRRRGRSIHRAGLGGIET